MNRGECTERGAVVTTMATTMSGFRYFTTERIGDATVAHPVDAHLQGTALAELIKHELLQIYTTTQCKMAILDFQNVKLVSSSVISSLLGVKRHLSASGTPFVMCGMSDSLHYVFRTLNLDGSVFHIVSDVAAALNEESDSTSYYYDVCGRLSPPDDESP